jgi:hypothetical protein
MSARIIDFCFISKLCKSIKVTNIQVIDNFSYIFNSFKIKPYATLLCCGSKMDLTDPVSCRLFLTGFPELKGLICCCLLDKILVLLPKCPFF